MNSMRENSISMSKPDINEDDVNFVVSALRSGQLSIGPLSRSSRNSLANISELGTPLRLQTEHLAFISACGLRGLEKARK
jgi:dTDP-4-amino-4,6-dideoxygalactose transaminase